MKPERYGLALKPHFLLELRPLASDPRDPTYRLRRALKVLLRSFGLRCVKLEEVKDDQPLHHSA